ncbi:ABC transporter permease subunit, partial [Mesorhizobium sp. M7D.F.Ca.US.004.01.2.1]
MTPAYSTDSRVSAGIVALAAIALLIGGAFAGLLFEGAHDFSGAWAAFDPYLLRVIRFTLWQAALSTLLSVVPALFVARALSRHPRFFGRAFILQLFAVPLALPAIVAALGILALYGRAGYFAGVLAVIGGGSWPGIYGLSGILVAHVFFNLPLATRLFLEALQTIPADQWRLASQLGMSARPAFRLIEWPTLRAAMPGVAGLVFMLCITSFTIVLILGGGPAATTLEVGIYQALRFDFDPARAVTLTLLQIALTFIVVLALTRLGANVVGDTNLPVAQRRYLLVNGAETWLNAMLIVLALLFVVGPMAATVTAGLGADLGRLAGEATVRQATLTSMVLA